MKRSNMMNQRSLWIGLLATTLTLGSSLMSLGCAGDTSSSEEGVESTGDGSNSVKPQGDPMTLPAVVTPNAVSKNAPPTDPMPLPAAITSNATSPKATPTDPTPEATPIDPMPLPAAITSNAVTPQGDPMPLPARSK